MSTGRVVAGLVVFLALLGVGLYVKIDMENREQPPHFKRMVEQIRGARELAEGLQGMPSGARDLDQAGRAIERFLAEAVKEAEAAAREPRRSPAPRAALAPLFRLGGDGDGPTRAPEFGDPLPNRPAASGPARMASGTHDGAYLVLTDGSAWEVGASHRETVLDWTTAQDLLPGHDALENEATGQRILARRLLAQAGRRVKSLAEDGRTVSLDDGSVWYVQAEHRVEIAFWTPPTEVVVLPEALLSPLRGRAVAARRVR